MFHCKRDQSSQLAAALGLEISFFRILPSTVECRRLRNWVILYYFTNFHLRGQFSDQFVIVDLDPMYTPQIVDLDPMYTPQIFTKKYLRPENNPNISEFFSVF